MTDFNCIIKYARCESIFPLARLTRKTILNFQLQEKITNSDRITSYELSKFSCVVRQCLGLIMNKSSDVKTRLTNCCFRTEAEKT